MNCLPCFGNKNAENKENEEVPVAQPKANPSQPHVNNSAGRPSSAGNNQQGGGTNEGGDSSVRAFTFRELASATKNFRQGTLLGESAFGKVYKGTFQASGKVVAVKQLDRHGTKASKEFQAEVMNLGLLKHPNLADFIGYCADGEQRLLVYEYMQLGSLKDHLFENIPEKKTLDWITRMKIASGTAQAVEYLHEMADPPVIYRNLKSSNVLLDENCEPKLTDYGLTKLEIESSNNMQQRVMGTYGCAPEYEQNGELTLKTDVYSFGVVLLELITGRRALDTSRPMDQQNIVNWAQPYFKDPKRFPEMADPQLQGAFPERSLNQAVGVAALCVQEEPSVRPLISDIVAALSFLTVAPPEGIPKPAPANPAPMDAPPHKDSSSSSSSGSESEPEAKLEAALSRKGQNEEMSCTSGDDDEERDYQNDTTKHNVDKAGSSSSESLYNEDDYGEEESPQPDMSHKSIKINSKSRSRSKSRSGSSKKKVAFDTENGGVSRKSSKKSGQSFKTHSSSSKKDESSLKGSSVSWKSSRKNSRKVDFSSSSTDSVESNDKSTSRSKSKSSSSSFEAEQQKIKSISRRKSIKKSEKDESSDSSESDHGGSNNRMVSFSSRKSVAKSDSMGDGYSDVEYSDGSERSISRDEFQERSTSSNLKFDFDSRCEMQDESDHGSCSSHGDTENDDE